MRWIEISLAPAGIVRFVPRALYLAPGGFALSVALPFGYAPSSFQRSYERDNPNFSAVNPDFNRDLMMSPGDRITIHLHDTPAGFRADLTDQTTHQHARK